jgi:Transporter associated domain
VTYPTQEDEFDFSEDSITLQEDGSYVVRGDADLEDCDTILGLNLGTNEEGALKEFATISGFLCMCAGEIPVVGDFVMSRGWCFEIIAADDKKVLQVKAERLLGGPRQDEDSNNSNNNNNRNVVDEDDYDDDGNFIGATNSGNNPIQALLQRVKNNRDDSEEDKEEDNCETELPQPMVVNVEEPAVETVLSASDSSLEGSSNDDEEENDVDEAEYDEFDDDDDDESTGARRRSSLLDYAKKGSDGDD